jgi:hypothetical protein
MSSESSTYCDDHQSVLDNKCAYLRMDECEEPVKNLSKIPLLVVQFRFWEDIPSKKMKEMRTYRPFVTWIPNSQHFSFFDLRTTLATKMNLKYRNINIAHAPKLPIMEGQLRPVRHLEAGPSLEPPTEEDILESELSKKQNRESREFKFNVERSIPVSTKFTNPFRVICVENMKKKEYVMPL